MKKVIFLILFTNFLSLISSQTVWIEQNSGVTTSLNSVVNGSWGNSAWICGNNGVVLFTGNLGVNWTNVSSGKIPTDVNLNTISEMYTIPGGALAAGIHLDTALVYRTTNNGTNWQVVFRQYQGYINGVISGYQFGFIIGNPVGGRWSIWKTTNEGLTWDSTGLRLMQSGAETGWNNSVKYINSYLYFGTNNSKVYYSTNNGTGWNYSVITLDTNASAMDFGRMLAYSSGYIGGSSHVLYTTNFGANWQDNGTLPGSGRVNGLVMRSLPVDVIGSFMLMMTRYGNKIFELPGGSINWIQVYIAPAGNYTHLSNNYDQLLVAVRDNGGISFCPCLISGINPLSKNIPGKFALYQNYPNSFNPITKIKFDVPSNVKGETSNIKLIVYDILGREVKTLVNESSTGGLSPGTYSVEFDGTNYPSGVYFYKLVIDDASSATGGPLSITKKMVLVK